MSAIRSVLNSSQCGQRIVRKSVFPKAEEHNNERAARLDVYVLARPGHQLTLPSRPAHVGIEPVRVKVLVVPIAGEGYFCSHEAASLGERRVQIQIQQAPPSLRRHNSGSPNPASRKIHTVSGDQCKSGFCDPELSRPRTPSHSRSNYPPHLQTKRRAVHGAVHGERNTIRGSDWRRLQRHV